MAATSVETAATCPSGPQEERHQAASGAIPKDVVHAGSLALAVLRSLPAAAAASVTGAPAERADEINK